MTVQSDTSVQEKTFMVFTRASKYHQVSDCGQYTVCWVSGKYEAWHLKEQLEVNLETADESREICQAHRERSQTSSTAVAATVTSRAPISASQAGRAMESSHGAGSA
jgi:hypothetical protein